MKINIEPKKIYKKVAINLFEKAKIKVVNKMITLTELQPSTIRAIYLELQMTLYDGSNSCLIISQSAPKKQAYFLFVPLQNALCHQQRFFEYEIDLNKSSRLL